MEPLGLKIKQFREILGDMVTWMHINGSKVTNFRTGSVTRTLLEAVAVDLESMYFKMKSGFNYAIENAIFNSFNFSKAPAIPASGNVTLEFKAPLTQQVYIDANTEFFTVPLEGNVVYFHSTENVLADVGSIRVVVPVVCDTPGTIGNVPPYSIKRLVNQIAMVNNVYNVDKFFTGAPEESDQDRKKRFSNYIQSIGRGTVSSLKYGCLLVPGVVGVYIDEQIGVVYVYAHNSSGELPDDLKSAIENQLLDYRAAGIPVKVSPVVEKPIDITLTVTLNPGFDTSKYAQTVKDGVTTYLNYRKVSQPLIKADLTRFIMSIDENAILNVSMDLTGDIDVASYELIRAGVITVSMTD